MVQWNDNKNSSTRTDTFQNLVEKLIALNGKRPIDKFVFDKLDTLRIGFRQKGEHIDTTYIVRVWGFRNNQKNEMTTELNQLLKYNTEQNSATSTKTNENKLNKFMK